MRVFAAIRLDENMQERVLGVQESFRRQRVTGSYTPRENLHLTLAFIGEYGDPEKVLEAMESLSFRPFTITMDRLGCFGELWWAGFAGNAALEKLVRSLRRALAEAGIPFDKKSFRAHVTFLRRARFSGEGSPAPTDFEPAQMRVTEICLMESRRGRNGMIYTELGSIPAKQS